MIECPKGGKMSCGGPKIDKATELRLAADIARGLKTVKELAEDYHVEPHHMYRIMSGRSRPRVRRLADEMIQQNVKDIFRQAKSGARRAIFELQRISQNAAEAGGKRPYKGETQRQACRDVIEIALLDVAEAHTSHHILQGELSLSDFFSAEPDTAGGRIGELGPLESTSDEEQSGQVQGHVGSNGHNGQGNGNGRGNGSANGGHQQPGGLGDSPQTPQ